MNNCFERLISAADTNDQTVPFSFSCFLVSDVSEMGTQIMNKVSTTASVPLVHNFERKKSPFPPSYDVTILQNAAGPAGRINWSALKTVQSALKFGQLIASILTLVFIRPRLSYYSERFFWPELPYFIVAFTAAIGAVVLLFDAILVAQPHRRAFFPEEWFRVNLWYTGLTTVTYYTMAFSVLVMALWDFRSSSFNIWAAAFGFVAAALYVADWWMHFCKRRDFGDKPKEEDSGKTDPVNLIK